MRKLEVIGLEPDGSHVVCADVHTGEKFRLPADEKLRAACRGDIARLGQIEIEMDSQLRPREIQARIRGGASVEQVAEAAGIPLSKVERFAYPVLLERFRAAEMAQKGHPVQPDGPAVHTLMEIVTQSFRARGHNIKEAEWDAWRDDEGHWVAQLQWQAGRSTNSAHWRYQPDAHGGTITPLDDTAIDLVDPDVGRPLRSLAPVPMEALAAPESTAPVIDVEIDERESVVYDDEVDTEQSESASTPQTAPDEPNQPKPAPQQAPGKDKRGKPALPSWDDVLLGVRSSGRG